MIAQKILKNTYLMRFLKENRFLYEAAQGLRSWVTYRSRKIFSVTLMLTNRCNSRCKVCNIWQKQPKEDMPVGVIADLLKARCLSRMAAFVLAGGEPLLHPQIDEILTLFKGRKHRIASNGLMPERLEEIVERYGVREVDISLDGMNETYRESRGVDGFARAEESIRRLKGKALVTVVYTFSPYNKGGDFEAVRDFCAEQGVRFAPNIYSCVEYGEASVGPERIEALERGNGSGINNPYLLLYNDWLEGRVGLPCLSLRNKTVVYPNGDVSLCQVKFRRIGNLTEQTMDEIWNDPATKRLQDEFSKCNECWVSCHRESDVHMLRMLRRFMPKKRFDRKYPSRGLDLVK